VPSLQARAPSDGAVAVDSPDASGATRIPSALLQAGSGSVTMPVPPRGDSAGPSQAQAALPMGEWQRLLYEEEGSGADHGAAPATACPLAHTDATTLIHGQSHTLPLLEALGSDSSGVSGHAAFAGVAAAAHDGWQPRGPTDSCATAGQEQALGIGMLHDWQAEAWEEQQHLQQHHAYADACQMEPTCNAAQPQMGAADAPAAEPDGAYYGAAGAWPPGTDLLPREDGSLAGAVFEGLQHATGVTAPPAYPQSPLELLATLTCPQACVATPHAPPPHAVGRGAAADPVLAAGARTMAEQLVQLARTCPDLVLGIMGGILEGQGLAPAPAVPQGCADAGIGGLPQALTPPAGAVAAGEQVPPYARIQQLPSRHGQRRGVSAKRRRVEAAQAGGTPGHSAQPQAVPVQVMSALLQLMATAVQAQKEHAGVQHLPQHQQQCAPPTEPAPELAFDAAVEAVPATFDCMPRFMG
jgi:hypothetical protein